MCGPSPAMSPRVTRTGSWSPPKAGNEGMAQPRFRILFGVALSLISGAMTARAADQTLRLPGAQAEPLKFSELNGWTADDQGAAFGSFLKSCKAIRAGSPPSRAARPVGAAL